MTDEVALAGLVNDNNYQKILLRELFPQAFSCRYPNRAKRLTPV